MKLLKTIKRNYFEILPPMIFFIIAFSLILLSVVFETRKLYRSELEIRAETMWPHFRLIQMWLIVLFFVYCAMRELVRAIGKDKVIPMFFWGAAEAERIRKQKEHNTQLAFLRLVISATVKEK